MIEVFDEKYYSIREAAAMAHCAKSRLYSLRRAGLLAALECELPGRPPAARRILRERFGWVFNRRRRCVVGET